MLSVLLFYTIVSIMLNFLIAKEKLSRCDLYIVLDPEERRDPCSFV